MENIMNYVTFKIDETKSGDFVLFLHNHHQKLISEVFRSKDLDQVVSKLKGKMEYRKHFMNALCNYVPVLNIIDDLEQKYPDAKNDKFPEEWKRPLELYGCYGKELDDSTYRESREIEKLFTTKSPLWIWKNRIRLVAERLFIRDF
jgi:hypothetical protein